MIGPRVEVPVLLALVKGSLQLEKRYFRRAEPDTPVEQPAASRS